MRISLGLKILGGNVVFVILLVIACWHAYDQASEITVVLCGVGVGALVAIFINFIFYKSIMGSIRSMADTVQAIARGDLGRSVLVNGDDELAVLGRGVNEMVDRLRGMVLELQNNSNALTISSQELASTSSEMAETAGEMNRNVAAVARGGSDLSANTSSMAAGADQMNISANAVASSLEEMSVSINEVAHNCTKESDIARQAPVSLFARSLRSFQTSRCPINGRII